MMKQSTSFLKRCAALALALVLLVSSSNLGFALTVLAGETTETVTEGQLVANNYDLSTAEKNLLSSGILAGGSVSYTVPADSDNLVAVDTDAKTIEADSYENWVPTAAKIMVGKDEKETVTLTNGKGSYTYAGNAFSVEVEYVLNVNVDANVQETMLNTAAWLKAGVANANALKDQGGNLMILETAMPELVNLADNGIKVGLYTAQLSEECKNAIYALNAQMTANGGKLNMSVVNAEYNAAASKVEYVLTKGTAMKAELDELVKHVYAVNKGLATIVGLADSMISAGLMSAAEAEVLKTLAGSVETLYNGTKAVADADWTAANKGTALVKAGITAEEYLILNELVAAVNTTTASTVKNPLNVDKTSVKVNMAMFNVTVKVVLNTVKNNKVTEFDSKETVIVLGEKASAEEIMAAIQESGAEAAAIAAWGETFVAGQYKATATELPATLTEDITYTVTYNPVEYTVSVAGESNAYPYGYEVTLPKHADSKKAYDYYDANNEYYPQGSVIVVDKALSFTREEGEAYTTGHLLNILAGNYASENAKVNAILNSGALKGDATINYRKPSADVLEKQVTLVGNVLTAQTYPSSYKGLSWAPATYVVDGVEHKFNGATQVTISGDFDEVVVYYTLVLSNYSKSDVQGIFDLVEELNAEAEGQLSVLNTLASYGEQMSILNMTMMQGLQAMVQIQGMKDIIGQMMDSKTGCFDANGNLILNNIIAAYNDSNNGGLYYYYTNDAFVRGEIDKLSTFLNQLLGKEEYKKEISRLLGTMGYAEYTDKLDDLSAKLDDVSKRLVAKNNAIKTSDAGALRKLSDALVMTGSATVASCDSPFITLAPVVRAAEKYAIVTVEVTVNDASNTTPITAKVMKGEKLTAAQVAELKAAVEAFVTGTGINTKYYETNYNASELDALAKKGLESSVTFKFNWDKKSYTIDVPGSAAQTVDIDNLTIKLPAHPNAASGMSYVYTVDGTTANSGIFTLTLEQLDKAIAGKLEITREEKNEAIERLVKMVAAVNEEIGYEALVLVKNKDGNYTGINATMGMGDMMNFVMGMAMNKYTYNYIGLGGEGMKYATADGLEISMQTVIDAVLTDEGFNNDRLISLAQKGKGTIVSTTMELGNSAEEINFVLNFNLALNSVPAALKNNVSYIKSASKYLQFQAKDGVLNVDVELPDQVYGAYAAALVATGNVDKTDVNAIGQAVAVQFLYDYFEAIIGSDMDMVTYTNTMKMLGLKMDLTGYNNYYAKAVAAYGKCIDVAISDNGTDVTATVPGNAAINALLKVTGAGNVDGLTDLLAMVKEYKAGNTVTASVHANVVNTGKTYYALIVDAQANGMTNKFEAPSSVSALKSELKSLAGYSAVILLDDVKGDLKISGTTVLDLNGKTVEGSIKSTGNLYIIDSSMDTYKAGTVTEGVSGKATIIAGNYGTDVSELLKKGYYMDGTTVRNELYKIVATDNRVEFVVDANAVTDLPSVKAMAIDIAADLALNYAYYGYLAVDGYELVDIKVDDLLGLYDSRDIKGLAKTLIGCVTIGEAGYENDAGFEALVNLIIEDLLDFGTISEALANNTALAEHELTLQPWKIDVAKAAAGDYATVNVGTNADLTKNVTFALTVQSSKNAFLSKLTAELDKIVEDRTKVKIDIPADPAYAGGVFEASVAGKANVYVDMSVNNDYATIIGVVLAYGNTAKRAAVAAAINSGDMTALKAVVDNTTAAELIKALKVMSRNVNFAAMAKAVGVTVDVASASELESLYHTILCGMGKVLEEAAITGPSQKLGALYNENTGYYSLTMEDVIGKQPYNTDVAYELRGYLAVLNMEATELSLNVKIFATETCMIGDVNHDDVIDGEDATLVLQYYAEMEPSDYFCYRGANTDGNDVIDGADATLILQYYAEMIDTFPAESK